ncbi:MAG: sigma-70 family RNA polymerase sigma factor [Planctomycetota bacterium]
MDADAARQLDQAYADHAGACRSFATTFDADVDDATHEAFVKLARRLANGDGLPDHPRAWLLAAVRSAAFDQARSRRRRQRREAFAIPPTSVPDSPDPEVVAALWKLDERPRQAIVLRLWCDVGFAEVAVLLGCAASTAHDLYRRGLDDLRDLLPEHDPSR